MPVKGRTFTFKVSRSLTPSEFLWFRLRAGARLTIRLQHNAVAIAGDSQGLLSCARHILGLTMHKRRDPDLYIQLDPRIKQLCPGSRVLTIYCMSDAEVDVNRRKPGAMRRHRGGLAAGRARTFRYTLPRGLAPVQHPVGQPPEGARLRVSREPRLWISIEGNEEGLLYLARHLIALALHKNRAPGLCIRLTAKNGRLLPESLDLAIHCEG